MTDIEININDDSRVVDEFSDTEFHEDVMEDSAAEVEGESWNSQNEMQLSNELQAVETLAEVAQAEAEAEQTEVLEQIAEVQAVTAATQDQILLEIHQTLQLILDQVRTPLNSESSEVAAIDQDQAIPIPEAESVEIVTVQNDPPPKAEAAAKERPAKKPRKRSIRSLIKK